MTGFVYAIGAADRVKIGWSSDPLRRLNKLRTDCPTDARLLGIVEATKKQESEIHQLLRRWWIDREWFRLAGAVVAFVEMMPQKPIVKEVGRRKYFTRGNQIREARLKLGLTQKQFADPLGVSRAAVCRWENGSSLIDRDFLRAVAEKTGINPADLRPDLADLLRQPEAAE